MKFFLTDSTQHLKRLLSNRGAEIAQFSVTAFADGELSYRLEEDVKRKPAVLVASVLPDPKSLFDIMVIQRLLRENKSLDRTLVIPYLGYARQDRPVQSGEGSIGVMVAELIRNMNFTKVIPIDVHSDIILKSLGTNAEPLPVLPLFARALKSEPVEIIVSPDRGSYNRVKELAQLFEPAVEFGYIEKVRPQSNVAVAKKLHADVKGKHVVIFDDMIDTGGTIEEAVRLISKNGAMTIRVAATHGIFSNNGQERILRLPIRELIITNTLHQTRHPKTKVLDISDLLIEKLLA